MGGLGWDVENILSNVSPESEKTFSLSLSVIWCGRMKLLLTPRGGWMGARLDIVSACCA